MRSTGFVVLSILVHCLAVAAIALKPVHISEPGGASVEVSMGEESETPGAADAPADKVTEAAPAPKAEPQPEVKAPVQPAPAPVVEKPVEKPVQKPVVKKAAPKKAVVAKAPVQKTEPTQQQPENLEPDITENVQTVPPAPVEEKQVEQAPVEEAAPVAAAAVATPSDEKTEAAAEDASKKVADPVAAAAPAGASDEINNLTQGGDLGQGGATKAGAVEYTELKQMSGNRAPFYPLSARREKRQGNVELLYKVTKQGTVTDVQIATSSGSDDLDKEAVRAISKFRFVPGQEGWARHPVQFSLKGDTAAAPSRLRTKVGAQDAAE